MKFQQYTGPVQAKGLEDTAFYRYNVLLSLNEVGGDPSRFGRSVEEFHEANAARRGDVAVRDARHRDARHQARRRRARADQRPLGDARRVEPRGRRAGCASTRRTARSSTASRRRIAPTSTASTRRSIGVWPPDVPSRTRHRRPPELVDRLSRIHAQGGEGGQGAHQLADAERDLRRRARPVRRARADRRRQRRLLAAFLPFQARIASLGMVNSLAQVVAENRLSRRAGFLPGHRALGFEPGRSRTTGGRSTSSSGRGSSTTSMPCSRRNRGTAPPSRSAVVDGLAGRAHQAARHGRWAASAARAAARLSRRELSATRHGDHRAGGAVAFAEPPTRERDDEAVFLWHPGCAMR